MLVLVVLVVGTDESGEQRRRDVFKTLNGKTDKWPEFASMWSFWNYDAHFEGKFSTSDEVLRSSTLGIDDLLVC